MPNQEANREVLGRGRSRLEWSVADDGDMRITLSGVIDERAELGRLATEVGDKIGSRRVVLDLIGITRITSAGVREWILFMRGMPKGRYVWDTGAPVMIKQANAIVGFLGGATITSFLYPFYCPRCEHEQDQRFVVGQEIAKGRTALAPVSCAKCQSAMEPSEDPTQYLAFLDE